MAAVIDYQTGYRIDEDLRPELTLIEGGVAREPRVRMPSTRIFLPLVGVARVYLFRRLMVTLAALGVVVIAGVIGSSVVGTFSADPPMISTHVVTSGETLWSIALIAKPNGDPRHTIDQIVAINSDTPMSFNPSEPLSVGQEILVPLEL